MQPYCSSYTARAWKNSHFILFEKSDFHIVINLSIAIHASCFYSGYHLLFSDAENSESDIELKKSFTRDDFVEETEKFPTQSGSKTLIVNGVPKTVDPEEVKLYFENSKSSKGGKITKFEVDEKNEIKITFDSSSGKIKKNFFSNISLVI